MFVGKASSTIKGMYETKSFYEYDDYRTLLKEKFEYLKSTTKKLSLEYLAKKIGISKSFLKMVLDGDRHISLDKLAAVAETFEMKRDEKNYFIFLACRNSVDDKEMGTFFDGILKTLATRKGSYFPNVEELRVNNAIFNSSLSMTMQNMRQLEGYQEDPAWIKKYLKDPKVTLKDIEQVLETFKKNDIAPGSVDAVLSPTDDFTVARVGLRLAADVVADPHKFKPMKYYMCAYRFDEEKQKKAFQLFTEFHEKLRQMNDECKKATMVVFVSDNIFTVADTEP